MPFASAISEHPDSAQAAGEAIGQLLERLGPEPDLVLFFVTGPHLDTVADLAATIRATLAPGTLLGATAVSVAGGPHEVEEQPAVALWGARIGPVTPIRLAARPGADGWEVDGLEALPTPAPDAPATLLVLADPFTFPVDRLLDDVAADRPHLQVVGGLASAGARPRSNRLVLDDEVVDHGAVGVLLGPEQPVTPVVSQGCRPIGVPWVVTRSEGNLIQELAGRPALERLQDLADQASPDDRELLAQGLHLGHVIDEHREDFNRGDFLVRNVLGADPHAGALAVGAEIPVGSTVQFQVRDAASADEDLWELLGEAGRADSALLFTCNGRGTNLFDGPDHDARVVDHFVTDHAIAGMFCAGEIGPVGTRSFLHGFTASVALLHERDRRP